MKDQNKPVLDAFEYLGLKDYVVTDPSGNVFCISMMQDLAYATLCVEFPAEGHMAVHSRNALDHIIKPLEKLKKSILASGLVQGELAKLELVINDSNIEIEELKDQIKELDRYKTYFEMQSQMTGEEFELPEVDDE